VRLTDLIKELKLTSDELLLIIPGFGKPVINSTVGK
jgi:hypothetical protein